MRKIVILLGILLALASFSVLVISFSSASIIPVSIELVSSFGSTLWLLRGVDVMLQVMLIFTCAMGILVFFADGDKK